MSRAGPHRGVDVRHRRRAREARIGVNDLGALELRLHHPAEGHRVTLRHVRALDEDGVGVDQAAGKRGGRSATQSHPQTGDAGGVSYAGLVFDGDDPQTPHQLLLHVVPLVVHGGAAEREDGSGRHLHLLHRLAVWSGGLEVSWKVSSRVFLTRSATISIASASPIVSHCVAPGLRCSTWVSRLGLTWSW